MSKNQYSQIKHAVKEEIGRMKAESFDKISGVVQEALAPLYAELDTKLKAHLAKIDEVCFCEIKKLHNIVEKQGEKIEWLLSCRREVPVGAHRVAIRELNEVSDERKQ